MTGVTLGTSGLEPSHQVLEQAADWFALLLSGEVSDADRRRWEVWFDASEAHRQAWRRIEALSSRFSPIRASAEPRLAASAYRRAGDRRHRRRPMLLGVAALAGSGLLGWAVWRQTALPDLASAWMADYRNGVGATRQITLVDGSRVWLDAESAFSMDFEPARRRLRLVRGQFFVDTARDPQGRPFVVDSPQGRLRALGTRFSVRLDDPAHTTLAVFEHAVEVRTANGASTVVRAGQQVRFSADGLSAIEPADAAREAWTRGLLIARDMPLADVVAALRRHHHGHLGLSPELAGLRVFGSYPIHDPAQTLAMLEAILPIRVRRPLSWWISIGPAEDAGAR